MKPATDDEHYWEGAHIQMIPSRKTCLKNYEHTFRRESVLFYDYLSLMRFFPYGKKRFDFKEFLKKKKRIRVPAAVIFATG